MCVCVWQFCKIIGIKNLRRDKCAFTYSIRRNEFCGGTDRRFNWYTLILFFDNSRIVLFSDITFPMTKLSSLFAEPIRLRDFVRVWVPRRGCNRLHGKELHARNTDEGPGMEYNRLVRPRILGSLSQSPEHKYHVVISVGCGVRWQWRWYTAG